METESLAYAAGRGDGGALRNGYRRKTIARGELRQESDWRAYQVHNSVSGAPWIEEEPSANRESWPAHPC